MMYLLLSVIAVLVVMSLIPIVLSDSIRGEFTVPNWVKNTAGWWASDQIPDSAFLQGIQFLINEGIMIVEIPAEIDSEAAEEIPNWVKNTAGWWAEDKIHDITFVSGIKYLIGKGIIVVEQEPEVEESVEEVVEVKDFYMKVNGGNCCFNWGYVGEEYRFQIETLDEHNGSPIDGVTITVKITSEGGELRHNFGQVTTEDGIYKNSITIPNMDWYAGNILSVTGEYYGVEKTIEKEFEVFKQRDGTSGSYGAGAGDCALTGPISVNSNGEAEIQHQGFTFSEDAKRMFVIGSTMDDVFEYELSGAYCISTLSTPLTYYVNSKAQTPTGIAFDLSGKEMFVVGKNQDKVHQYHLTEPWLLNSTASYVRAFSVASQDNTPEGLTFDPSGKKMFIVGQASNTANKGEVNQYNLTEPFDISSASHVAVMTMSFTSTYPTGITFDPSGKKMFISDQGKDTIRQYKLTEPFNISSNSTGDANTLTLDVSSEEATVRDVWFDASGKKMFILGFNGKDVTTYKLTEPFDLTSASAVS